MRPRLSGNNIALWRHDFERVNGFDEEFIGWGLEDRDLQRRLEAVGVRVRSILHRTTPIHLWHEPAPSFQRNGTGTENLRYYSRHSVPAYCLNGLVKPDDSECPTTVPLRTWTGGAAEPVHRRAA
jgi:hypothetical protein